jgi:hypothetical protein
MGEENGTIQAVAVKFHHFQAVARCAGAEAQRFSVPGVHLHVMQDRVVFETTDGDKAGVLAIPIQAARTALDDGPTWDGKCLALPPEEFQAVIPLPKWTAIKPKARQMLPCSSTLYLSFPNAGEDQTPKVRMKCGLDGEGPVLTLDLLERSFPKLSRVTPVSDFFHFQAKQAATFNAEEMESLAGAFDIFHGPTSGRRFNTRRPVTIIPTSTRHQWGMYAEDQEDIQALFYVVLMPLLESSEVPQVHDPALLPLLRSVAGDLRDPQVAAEEDALETDHLAYSAMAENGKRLHAAGEARAAQELLDSIVA